MCIEFLEKIKCGSDEFIVVKVDRATCTPNQMKQIADAMQRLSLRGFIVNHPFEVDKMTRGELTRVRDGADRILKE